MEGQQCLLLHMNCRNLVLSSFFSVGTWNCSLAACFPSMPLRTSCQGVGRGSKTQLFVNSFSVNCSVTVVELLGSLMESPGLQLEMFRKSSSKKNKMRQQFFQLTICHEVGRPCRKCFRKQGAQSSRTALSFALPTCTLPSPFLFLSSQHYRVDWPKSVTGGYSSGQLRQYPCSFGFFPL